MISGCSQPTAFVRWGVPQQDTRTARNWPAVRLNMLPGLASQLSPHGGPGPSKMTERSARCFEQTSYPAATVFSLNSCGGPDKVAFAAAP
jgi:hypothetical protein